jgi:hypothetical protein
MEVKESVRERREQTKLQSVSRPAAVVKAEVWTCQLASAKYEFQVFDHDFGLLPTH